MNVNSTTTKPGWLFVLPWELHYPGGVNQVVTNIYDGMESSGGIVPHVMVPDWEATRPRCEFASGKRIVRYRLRPAWSKGFGLRTCLIFALTLPLAVVRLRTLFRTHNIRVINQHYPTLTGFVFLIMRKLRLFDGRIIASIHGTDLVENRTQGGLKWRLWQYMLSQADDVVACSKSLETEYRKSSRYSADNLSLIYSGYEPGVLQQLAAGHPVPPCAQRYVLSVGTFEHKKGHDILLRAFKQVITHTNGLSLILIGRSGPVLNSIRELIDELDLARIVTVIEGASHPETISYIKSCHIFVLASRYEPFGMVLLEAGALGRPVVAAAIGGIPEIIEHNRHGLLFCTENIEALVGAICQFDRDAKLRSTLASALEARVTSYFALSTTVGRYSAIGFGNKRGCDVSVDDA